MPAREPSVTYFTISGLGTGITGLTKRLGTDVGSSGNTYSFDARVPIAGWIENQNAPLLVNSITTAYPGLEKKVTATITNAGSCAIANNPGSWLTSATLNGTGRCDLVWPVGTWSAAPTCTCSGIGSTAGSCAMFAAEATTGVSTYTRDNTGSALNTRLNIECTGPR